MDSHQARGELTDNEPVVFDDDPPTVRELADAIRADAIHVVYQPKFDLVSGELVGVEALARWVDPVRGVIGPTEFIPLAERTGLIHELGEHVLTVACKQLRAWQYAIPRSVNMAVNVSPVQFNHDLAVMVGEVLDRTGIAPSLLTLEVTESTVMANVRNSAATLRAINDRGVGVAIDDFGTGHSSLAQLKQLPLSQLKIDQSFVTGLGVNDKDSAICGAIVALAHGLDLEVVAEGIENRAQLAEVRRLGCEYGQGFLLGRPTDGDSIIQVMANGPLEQSAILASARSAARTVLIVDDHESVRSFASVSLSMSGYNPIEATNGRDALEVAGRVHPAVVLLDNGLPDIEGRHVCRELRQGGAPGWPVIIMVTGDADSRTKIAAYEAGADDYLVKPFSPRELVSCVKRALARSDDLLRRSWFEDPDDTRPR